MAGQTAPSRFLETVGAHPDLVMLRAMRGETPGAWDEWTASEYADLVARAAAGLQAHGVRPGERVLLMMRNRPDFHWFDAAAQFLRATPVSIYNSSSPEEIQYLASHAEAELAIVEDAGFLERILKVRDELPLLEQIFVLDPPRGRPARRACTRPATCWSRAAADLHALAAATSPDDLATLIYTSGTTGPPKGVMISQGNVVFTIEQLRRCFGLDASEFPGKRLISYLPMAHIAERMTSHYQGMVSGLSRHVAAPTRPRSRPTPARCTPRSCSACPGCGRRCTSGVNAALAADPEKQQKFDEGAGRRARDQGRRAGRHGDAGAARHVGLPRRGRLLPRPRAARARRR